MLQGVPAHHINANSNIALVTLVLIISGCRTRRPDANNGNQYSTNRPSTILPSIPFHLVTEAATQKYQTTSIFRSTQGGMAADLETQPKSKLPPPVVSVLCDLYSCRLHSSVCSAADSHYCFYSHGGDACVCVLPRLVRLGHLRVLCYIVVSRIEILLHRRLDSPQIIKTHPRSQDGWSQQHQRVSTTGWIL